MARANRSIVNSKPKPFISTWKTDNTSVGSSAANQIRIPVNPSGSYNFMVYWGDNTSSSISSAFQSDLTHSYASAGTYNVTMSGYIGNIRFNNGGDRLKLLSISQWGSLRISGGGSQFFGCGNLTLNNTSDTPNLYAKLSSNPTISGSMAAMFRSCSLLVTISRLDQWDTSKIGFMGQAFYNNNKFNQNIGNWNTGQVSDMQFMFAMPSTIIGEFKNGGSDSIGNWDVSNVNNINSMFYGQGTFNVNLGNWNVSKITNFDYAFAGTSATRTSSFNNGGSDSIKNWNVSSASRMYATFYGASQFNQPIGSWDVSNVTTMVAMLGHYYGGDTGSFNQPLNNWNTSKVTDMSYLFAGQSNFNQNIGSWDTSNVTNMLHMFNHPSSMPRDGVFNNGGDPSIKNWNVSKVKEMGYMFLGQPYFNQEIGLWNVSALTSSLGMFSVNIASKFSASQFNNSGSNSIQNWNTINLVNANQMFSNAFAFNQPLGGWKITSMSSAVSFMSGKTFNDYSTSNYDDLLIGWASQSARPNVSINFGTIRYTLAASASRAILTSPPNSWTIVDGGQI